MSRTHPEWVPTLKMGNEVRLWIHGGICVYRKERKEIVTLLNLYNMYSNFQRVQTFKLRSHAFNIFDDDIRYRFHFVWKTTRAGPFQGPPFLRAPYTPLLPLSSARPVRLSDSFVGDPTCTITNNEHSHYYYRHYHHAIPVVVVTCKTAPTPLTF